MRKFHGTVSFVMSVYHLQFVPFRPGTSNFLQAIGQNYPALVQCELGALGSRGCFPCAESCTLAAAAIFPQSCVPQLWYGCSFNLLGKCPGTRYLSSVSVLPLLLPSPSFIFLPATPRLWHSWKLLSSLPAGSCACTTAGGSNADSLQMPSPGAAAHQPMKAVCVL